MIEGINGIMVDLPGGGSHASITQANILDDFTFKVGNNNSPSSWAAAPNPTTVMVPRGAGDRRIGPRRIDLGRQRASPEVARSDRQGHGRHRPGGQRRVFLRQ